MHHTMTKNWMVYMLQKGVHVINPKQLQIMAISSSHHFLIILRSNYLHICFLRHPKLRFMVEGVNFTPMPTIHYVTLEITGLQLADKLCQLMNGEKNRILKGSQQVCLHSIHFPKTFCCINVQLGMASSYNKQFFYK